MKSKVLIILPTYNEAGHIQSSLRNLDDIRHQFLDEFDITLLNVDDSSPDGTAALAADMKLPNFYQLINQGKIGLGPAYLAGFKWGLSRNFDYFVEMDSDGSHLAVDLPILLAKSKHHDLIIGARWMAGGTIHNWPWYRILISKFGTSYASILLKLPLRDLTSGYRIMKRNFLESLDLDAISTKGYGFQIEMAFLAYVNGFSVTEVPITFIERSTGKSKMSLGIAIEAFRFVTKRGFERILKIDIRR